MDEPPFPPAGEPIPDKAEAVVRDALRLQDQLRGERHPPQQIPTRGCGLLTLSDQPSTSQGLTRGRSADASTEFSSSPESRWDPTERPNGARVVVQGDKHRYRITARVDTLTTHMAVQGP